MKSEGKQRWQTAMRPPAASEGVFPAGCADGLAQLGTTFFPQFHEIPFPVVFLPNKAGVGGPPAVFSFLSPDPPSALR